jgi:hypothetical protein
MLLTFVFPVAVFLCVCVAIALGRMIVLRFVRLIKHRRTVKVFAAIGGALFSPLSLPFVPYADYVGTMMGSSLGSIAAVLGAATTVGAVIGIVIIIGAIFGMLIGLGINGVLEKRNSLQQS